MVDPVYEFISEPVLVMWFCMLIHISINIV